MVQDNVFGKIHFSLISGGHTYGSINAENWRAWNFSILDATEQEVARITKTFGGLARAMWTNADHYLVQFHRQLQDPLRSLVVASAVERRHCAEAGRTRARLNGRTRAEGLKVALDPPIGPSEPPPLDALAEDLTPLGDLTSALLPAVDAQADRSSFASPASSLDDPVSTRRSARLTRPSPARGMWARAPQSTPTLCSGGHRPSRVDPHRRAHGSQLSRPPVRHRHHDAGVRRRGRAEHAVWDTRKTTPGLLR